MVVIGRIFKSETSKFWLAEAPLIGVFTQGTSRADAEAMLIDAVQEVVHRDGFKASVLRRAGDEVVVRGSDPAALAATVLRYQRETHQLTLSDVAKKLGVSSINSYAAYEQGKREPSLSKYLELLAAIAPELDVVVADRRPPGPGVYMDGKGRVPRSKTRPVATTARGGREV